jgi:hypothetical protein
MMNIRKIAKQMNIKLTTMNRGERKYKSDRKLIEQILNAIHTANKKQGPKKQSFGKKKSYKHIRTSKRGKGWAEISKKLDRSKMPSRYFLIPAEKKFPVRTQNGEISCKAIQSAILRARILYSKYGDKKYSVVLNKAKKLLSKYNCNKV